MRFNKILLTLLTGLTAAFLSVSASAENSQDFGEYVVHFNALATDLLPPKVAKEYGITRSQNRAMLNVAVLKKVLGTTGQPVEAHVESSATNLTGQTKNFKMREIREGTAIYYIGEISVSNEETLNFDLKVKPEGSDDEYTVRFRQDFFTR